MADNEHQLPDDIDYNEDDVTSASAERSLPDGWYRFICASADNRVTDKGNLATRISWRPLKDPTDPDSIGSGQVSEMLMPPIPNKAVEGHKAPETADMFVASLAAIFPAEVKPFPRRINNRLMCGDTEITKEETSTIRVECLRSAMKKYKEIFADPSILEGHVIYGYVKKSGDYTNLRSPSATLPAGKVLVEAKDFRSVASDSSAEARKAKREASAENGDAGKRARRRA